MCLCVRSTFGGPKLNTSHREAQVSDYSTRGLSAHLTLIGSCLTRVSHITLDHVVDVNLRFGSLNNSTYLFFCFGRCGLTTYGLGPISSSYIMIRFFSSHIDLLALGMCVCVCVCLEPMIYSVIALQDCHVRFLSPILLFLFVWFNV